MRNYQLSFQDYKQILRLLKGKPLMIHAGIEPRTLIQYDMGDNLNYEIEDKKLTIFNGQCLDFSEFEISIPNTNEIIEMTLDQHFDTDKNLLLTELCIETNNGYFITITEYNGDDYITKVNNKWVFKKVENITFTDGYEFFKHIPILQDLFVKK